MAYPDPGHTAPGGPAPATVEVLIPYYGDVDLMRRAVESVLAQDVDTWRLLVVDDAYPDPTVGEWLQGLDDGRVTYVRNEANLGINLNFAKILSLATGDRIVMMGCDDLLLPHYVRTVQDAVRRHPGATAIQPGVRVVDAAGRAALPLADRVKRWSAPAAGPDSTLSGEELARSLLHANWTYFPSIAWDRRAVLQHGFRPRYEVVQDLALLLDLTFSGGSLLRIPEDCFVYRRHEASVSSVQAHDGRRFAEEARLSRWAREECRRRGWHGAARTAGLRAASRLHALVALRHTLTARDPAGARRLGRHALARP